MKHPELLSRITVRPDVFGGKPIIRDMRISVELILSLLSQGVTPEELLDDYPRLESVASSARSTAKGECRPFSTISRVRTSAYQATSSRASGFLYTISKSVRAAPEGTRRPCSQS